MKRVILLILLLLTIMFPAKIYGVEDPNLRPNNRVGIHILFPTELEAAARLVNSAGGDWGYVTIPIQAGDKNLIKWQQFMDDCRIYHIIPIIRLATEGDYFNTTSWRKPNTNDIVDFANFLNSLSWPTKNRYVIVFNEVNRGDEWGGAPNASEYASILSFAVKEFKAKSQDFFVLSAGLDNAAPNNPGVFENEYSFMRDMATAVPSIYAQVDGLASHSYPNPGFSQPPTSTSDMSIMSYQYERELAQTLSGKPLPVFITETGWRADAVSDTIRASYYINAFTGVWNTPTVIAVTPFLLTAGPGPFMNFGFTNADGSPNVSYKALARLPKVKGAPDIIPPSEQVLSASTVRIIPLQTINFSKTKEQTKKYHMSQIMTDALKWIFKI